MGDHLLSTVKQVLNLALGFAQKVGIPFPINTMPSPMPGMLSVVSEYWEPQKNLLEDADSNSV